MADDMFVTFDDADAVAGLDKLIGGMESSVRGAAQAGAQVFYDEVRLRAGAIKKSGKLQAAIYQAFSRNHSGNGRATYHISWNASKAPHGHLVEFGHIQTRKVFIGSDGKWYTSHEPLPEPKMVAASPFIRPSYDAKKRDSLLASNAFFSTRLQALIAGLSA